MRVAVLSGKGGTGKTFVSVNLAVTAKKSTYIDCDVEEPNGRLFLKPQDVNTAEVNKLLPQIKEDDCVGCRKCVDACRFNALGFIKSKPMAQYKKYSAPLVLLRKVITMMCRLLRVS